MLKKMGVISMVLLWVIIAAISADQDSVRLDRLGKKLFFDQRLSTPMGQSCASCHGPIAGWAGPDPEINLNTAVYPGAIPERFGNRMPPTAAYASLSPLFDYDPVEGLFFGGNFWDGRATGWDLGNPAADQARGPFLNPVEQNTPDKATIVDRVCHSEYAELFKEKAEEIYPGVAICNEVEMAYDFIALAIAEFESSRRVNSFSSKFDYFIRGKAIFTAKELDGMELFNGKGNCAACHPAPLFTDHTYDNLGIPRNPDNPFYYMDTILLDNGEPINSDGENWVDPGLGGFLMKLSQTDQWRSAPYTTEAVLNLDSRDLALLAAENFGKHKVPTLRNVGKRPNEGFIKAYTHNGVFKSLKEVVHFYNKRDEMMVQKMISPEVSDNMNTTELGNLGLTDAEEDAIVAFMNTLSDGWENGRDEDNTND